MSKLTDQIQWLKDSGVAIDLTCFFCGEKAHHGAYWSGCTGDGDLVVCLHCIGKLGNMLGDAVADCPEPFWENKSDPIAPAIKKVTGEAYRAFALDLIRTGVRHV